MIHVPFFSRAKDETVIEDGLGQDSLTDALWIKRFRAIKKEPVVWQKPNEAQLVRFSEIPELDKFGDFVVAARRSEAQDWFVVERVWNGWPDPPKFAFFAVERDNTVWAAADFHRWPHNWVNEGFEI